MRLIFLFFFLLISFKNLSADELKKVSLQLQWKHQFEFAGYYIAKEKGFYKEAGLDVFIKEFDEKTNIVDEVVSQKSTFGVNYPSLILDKANGKDIVLLSAILQSSPHALVTLKSSGVNSLKDFENKTLMINPSAINVVPFISMLQSKKVSYEKIKKVPHTFDINDLINKKVDISTVFTTNELYHLDRENIEYKVWDPKDYGFNFYDNLLFTSSKVIKQNPLMVEKFRDASLKGWEYAFSNIDETVNLILEKYNSQNKSKDALLYEAKELKKLAYYKNKELGNIDENAIQRIFDVYNILSLTQNTINLDNFIYKSQNDSRKNLLSQKELNYLKNNKFNVYLNNWLPISIYNEKNHEFTGLSLDYFYKIKELIPLDSNFIYSSGFLNSINELKKDPNGIMISISQTKDREEYGSFSKPYVSYPIGIATRDNRDFIFDLSELEGKKIAVGKNFSAHKLLQKHHPNIVFVPVKNTVEALELLARGEVYGAADILLTLKYYMQKYSYTNLKVAGTSDFKFDVQIMVNKAHSELIPIINKTLNQINENDKRIYQNKWLQKITEIERVDYTLLYITIFIFLFILSFLLWRHKELSKYKNALEKKKTQLDDYINASTDFVWEINKHGVYTKVSKRVEDILGYTAQEMIGKSPFEFMPKNEAKRISKIFRELVDKRAPVVNLQNQNVHKSGAKVFLLTNAVAIFEGDKFKGYRGADKDITKEKQNDIIILEQSKMVAMGEMIGNIAHQWRQPLSLISTQATGTLFQKELGVLSDEDFKKNMHSINNSVQYLSETIETFRNFIKNSSDKEWVYVDLESEIEIAIMINKASYDNNFIRIIKEYTSEGINIKLPQGELSQVILNILNNAKDAHKNDLSNDEKWVKISIEKKSDHVLIIIEDNAGGIEDTIMDHIFEPYFTTKHQSQGTGLGLHMSYRIIVDSIKGKLYAINTDNGAKFFMELPLNN